MTKLKDYLKDNGDTVKVTLKKGYLATGTNSRVMEVEVREPMVTDQMAARKQGSDDAEVEMALVATLTGLTPDEVLTLSANDYGRISQAVAFFID